MAGSYLDRATTPDFRGRLRMFGKLAFWPLAALTLLAMALQFGNWHREFEIRGPFAAETDPAQASLILPMPKEGLAPWWMQPPVGDDGQRPAQSVVSLRINGQEMGPPHAAHSAIREGKTRGFSHWGGVLIFALPAGVSNSAETVVTLRYPLRPRSWMTVVLAVASVLLGIVAFGALPKTDALPEAAYLTFSWLCWAGLAGSALYVAVSLYALASGWALPTTAPMRWSSAGQWAARNEPHLGQLLLTLAGLGTLTKWLAASRPQQHAAVASGEQKLRRLGWCAFPILTCTFLLSLSAMWAGIVRAGDFDYSNIGGQIPFSDAGYYLASAYDQVRDGVWNEMALRRPLAGAFRSVLLIFANFSLEQMLVLQACLVAAAISFATYAVATWRGAWAAVAFLAMCLIYSRIFVPTTLTEPLGLFWAILSIPFFVTAIRDHAVKPALVGFGMTAVALMMRMGSMFTLPALLLWLVWQFGKGTAAKIKIGLAALCILLSVFGLNSLLERAYGRGPSASTGNFAYVLCGLSMGTTWDGCLKQLAAEGRPVQGTDYQMTQQLYSAAWDKFREKPSRLFGRLVEGVQQFYSEFWNVMWQGYGRAVREPIWLPRTALTAIMLIGLLYGAVRIATAVELTFWALVWASILASSAIIYLEDGSRALAASQPLIALFFALGMSGPASMLPSTQAEPRAPSRLARNGFIGLVTAAVLFACVPGLAHHFSSTAAVANVTPAAKPGEAYIYGGRRMSGFLVVEDGLPLPKETPSLHLAEFEAIIAQSSIEAYQDLIHPTLPPLPFGFISAPHLDKGSPSVFPYIVPAEVIERRDVAAWHLQLKRWGATRTVYGDFWFYATSAEPWP